MKRYPDQLQYVMWFSRTPILNRLIISQTDINKEKYDVTFEENYLITSESRTTNHYHQSFITSGWILHPMIVLSWCINKLWNTGLIIDEVNIVPLFMLTIVDNLRRDITWIDFPFRSKVIFMPGYFHRYFSSHGGQAITIKNNQLLSKFQHFQVFQNMCISNREYIFLSYLLDVENQICLLYWTQINTLQYFIHKW